MLVLENEKIEQLPLTNEVKVLCDVNWVRSTVSADLENAAPAVKIIDLYSGCGGMTLGIKEALKANGYKTEIQLAVDTDAPALKIYKTNFGGNADAIKNIDINELVSINIGQKLDERELKTQSIFKGVQILVAGPPCQGHSNLNNHTRRSDPRNNLYLNAIRFVELIRPKIAIIENVSTVIHDKDSVVQRADEALRNLGYTIHSQILDASKYGLAQSRKRHFQIAILKKGIEVDLSGFIQEPTKLSEYIKDILNEHTVKEGIFYAPSITQKINKERIELLFKNNLYDLPDEFRPNCHKLKNHSYKSCYGRMRWDKPAQTITSGFGSMGQGRYVHPLQKRVITPHEAARIQGFPDFFKFTDVTKRGDLHTMIANAVPPKLVAIIIDSLIKKNAL
jgi:DNA (cytosine-5)-methyltransferase 1